MKKNDETRIIPTINDVHIRKEGLRQRGFTDSAIVIFEHTRQRASARGLHGVVPPVLVLWSMLRWERKLGTQMLVDCGIDSWEMEKDIDQQLNLWGSRRSIARSDSKLSLRFDFKHVGKISQASREEANRLGHRRVGTEHIILALSLSTNKSLSKLLRAFGVSHKELLHDLKLLLNR